MSSKSGEGEKQKPNTTFDLFGNWFKDGNDDKTQEILKEKLTSKNVAAKDGEKEKPPPPAKPTPPPPKPSSAPPPRPGQNWGNALQLLGDLMGSKDVPDDKKQGKTVENLLEVARSFKQEEEKTRSKKTDGQQATTTNDVDQLEVELKGVVDQVSQTFESSLGHLKLDGTLLNPISLYYFLELEDSRKHASWRNRQHRFATPLNVHQPTADGPCKNNKDYEGVPTIYQFHDALYLAELSYCDTIEEIQDGLANFQLSKKTSKPQQQNNHPKIVGAPSTWQLIHVTTESKPREPAHFVALKLLQAAQSASSPFPWSRTESVLEILLVVRGTKELGDVVSDALLKVTDYGEGKAHDGILKAGQYLVEKHLGLFRHLLAESKRDKIKLQLVGHSLGAGAASIACLEFNKHDNIEATCIGFGCPALLDKESSMKCKDCITTVISDSDCVPRMSGATLANLILDIASHDWTDLAIEDVNLLLRVIRQNIPGGIMEDMHKKHADWIHSTLKTNISENILKAAKDIQAQERIPIELYPPGKCLHFYRDGVGISANFMDCDFFGELDLTRTMVDDHLIPTGYNRLILDFMRKEMENSRFFFPNDVAGLRAEKYKRGNSNDDNDSS